MTELLNYKLPRDRIFSNKKIKEQIMARLESGLIISCQAVKGEPLYGLGIMHHLARAGEPLVVLLFVRAEDVDGE